jgi:hypothetical protein
MGCPNIEILPPTCMPDCEKYKDFCEPFLFLKYEINLDIKQ